ncbi:gamma carbonic anhydrase family protein [Rubrolithibacter danxiaensis]|uniref:gamma carbonic anhydrase family protein n=1 Tax=Rubrolithibacter danxiaensis TaxID=3390805 RepID=UPI003BF80CAD
MALILPVKDKSPVWGQDCFIAENSTIVGDVKMGSNCSVWFNAVIRGDVNSISIGNNVNIQDGAVIHCTYLKAATTIGNNVSVGHKALVHGCTLKDNVLVGMGAIVMDHAVVESFTIIAAGAIVLENTVCESGFIYAGIPAKKIKPISNEQREMLSQLPLNYIMYSNWFQQG